VLAYLMHRKGQLVSRSELAEHVHAQDLDRESNTIEVFIGRLRKKLGVDLIRTVRGLGYRLEAELVTHLDQLTATLEAAPDGRPRLAHELSDPRFQRPLSGLYW
jgi:DNA-binding winged helix-turn-helix (wHTH) protein